MKLFNLKFLIILLFFSFISLNVLAQNGDLLWSKTTKEYSIKGKQALRKSQPKKGEFYKLDISKLHSNIQSVSKKTSSTKQSSTIMHFPNSDGHLEAFRVREASILEPDFQAKHDNIRSYVGQSVENPESVIYFSITPQGLHAMTLSSKHGVQFIDPYSSGNNTYVVYNKKDLPKLNDLYSCIIPKEYTSFKNSSISKTKSSLNANDGKLRTFRLALACTVEYATFQVNAANLSTGTDTEKKAAVLAAMVVTMTRVNGIFKRDLSLQMTLVNNDNIIFLAEPDGLTNNDANLLIDESQTVIDAAIGSSNYDIGHTFSTGAGGLAQLSSSCNNTTKAMGVTGLSTPVGDAYDVDFVTHEMGHQFGAPHTFNGDALYCGDNRTPSNAYEPGSGSTIMAYAGLCSPQNVQSSSDAYFHQKSLQMIWDNITSGVSTCANASAVSTGNTAPTAEAGNSYTIPKSTPYKLVGASTDVDGTATHTYTWEQYDLTATPGMPFETNVDGPLVRSFEGTTNPVRYIPRLEGLLISNGSTDWEKLASVSRPINFQLTVRDNDTRGGQTATDNMTATVDASKGPFMVTSQNTSGISWGVGSSQTITWDVAGTNTSPINTTNVNILLSTDGGLTYPTTLASNVPNNGSYLISSVPNNPAPYCRIMVEPVNNIYFAINSKNFSIGYSISSICDTFTSTDSNLPISITDDGSGFTETSFVNVPDSGVITDVNLTVNITHPFPGDVLLGLQSPDNTLLTILKPFSPCQGEDQNIVATFDDSGAILSCSTIGNGLTVKSPISSLSGWNGENTFGNWILGLGDGGSGDVGTLNSWSLDICYDKAIPLGTNEFEFNNFSVFPNPNKGIFTIQLDGYTGNDISINLYDLRGRTIYKNSFQNNGDFRKDIHLNYVQSGMYILNVSDGIRNSTKKLIIE
ncbi:reprolysin-like metallopeptidase [Tenacibaculum sp.]|uniref:reprolysin-like metallopeptidase n=1 Tax=Tenacibaculum sp. TaxID=1906242 RepID=UPI003D0AE3F9